MEYSKNFNFALPSRDNDVDLADINEISNNFRKIDENAVKKEVGKGLSTNDFTDEYKAKVENALTSDNIDPAMSDTSENPVQNKVVKGYVDNATSDISDEVSKKLDTVNGGAVSGNVEFTGDVIIQNAPTVPKSAVNKEYADSLKTVIDAEFSETSENPVQNKVIYENLSYLYDDLSNSLSGLQGQINENHPDEPSDRLFYTKTTQEVSAIEIYSDTKPYRLREFYYAISIPASPELKPLDSVKTTIVTEGNVTLSFSGRTIIRGGTLGNYHRYIVVARSSCGFWDFNAGILVDAQKVSSTRNIVGCVPDSVGAVTALHYNEKRMRVKKITISTTQNTAVFPIGTEIEVYGR